MGKETVEALIEGGKATAAPPLGPALGPLKVNIGEVVKAINEKTAGFKGMQVPIKVIVDTDTKEFEIEVGTPPAASLILKEANIQKGAGNPLADKVADLRIEQVIKIAKMKEDNLLGKDIKNKVREIIGTCQSMGVMVEGVSAQDALKQVAEGIFDEEIKAEKTELSAEELKEQEVEKQALAAETEKKYAEFEATANAILKEMEGKTAAEIKAKMAEAGLPAAIIQKAVATIAPAAGAEGAKEGEAKAEEAPKEEKK